MRPVRRASLPPKLKTLLRSTCPCPKRTSPLTRPQIFGNLIDNCFSSCINDFTSKSLTSAESGCLSRCVLKTMATNTRLGERFAENTALMNNQMQQQGR